MLNLNHTLQQISQRDQFIFDQKDNLIGIKNPRGNGDDLFPVPDSKAATTATSITLAESNIDQVLDVTAAATLTIPTDAVLLKPSDADNRARLIAYQTTSGAVTWAAGAGVTLVGTAPVAAQYLTTSVMHVAANTWAYVNSGTYNGPNTVTNLTVTGNAAIGDAEATDTHAIKGATTLLANSASAALTVTQTGAGNAFVVEDSASTDTTPFVINASGQVLIGTATAQAALAGQTPVLQAHSAAGSTDNSVLFANWDVTTGQAPTISFAKSVGDAIGTRGAVANTQLLGSLHFLGDDGTAFIRAAQITAEVDGTPGTNDMPGRLLLSTTADGASAPTERLRVDSAGVITARIGTAIPAGGTAGFGYCATSTANFDVFFGSGAPSLSAAKGSLYLRSDGSGTNDRMYVNTNGTTTWTAVVTVA